jgi:hypothetical protein
MKGAGELRGFDGSSPQGRKGLVVQEEDNFWLLYTVTI